MFHIASYIVKGIFVFSVLADIIPPGTF